MDRNTFRQTFVRLLEETTGETKTDVQETTELRTGLGLDSVDMVHLAIQVQTEFGVELTAADLEGVATVGGLLDTIQALMSGRAAA
ncbi:MAG: acyl carrier protein [Gemmataceae bacterium]